ncbi:MAG: tryptophan 2,3-dioxygenase family protein [Bacteroidota bacterium]
MENKYATVHYHNYLQLESLLGAQRLRSEEVSATPAHDEMLFIITHQIYELWFKQILHELEDVVERFGSDVVDERSIGVVVSRLNRIGEIQQLLIQQIHILETMTALDFLDFRNYLFPASGFQSFQFRKIEVLLGLSDDQRITYNQKDYKKEFSLAQQQELNEIRSTGTLFERIEGWLERTPFLQFGDFQFLEHYKEAVDRMMQREEEAIRDTPLLGEAAKQIRLQILRKTDTYFQSIFDPAYHQEMREAGTVRLSYKAMVAALLIHLYRDEPILHLPFALLNLLTSIDENLATWRYRHAQMVLRMLGRKMGTGGSSGHDYLQRTAAQHHIFGDLFQVSTLLIPRSELPPLPNAIQNELGFYFSREDR